MARHKRELYEILAERSLAQRREEGATPPPPRPREPARTRPRRALVITVDTGLAVFLVVAAMLGTAFVLGRRAKQRDIAAGLQERMRLEEDEIGQGGRTTTGGLREERPRSTVWPAEAWVLKLTSYPHTPEGLTHAKGSCAFVRGQALLAAQDLSARVLESSEAYTVAVGAAASRLDERLDIARQHFRTLSGDRYARADPPYAGCMVVQKGQLGYVIE